MYNITWNWLTSHNVEAKNNNFLNIPSASLNCVVSCIGAMTTRCPWSSISSPFVTLLINPQCTYLFPTCSNVSVDMCVYVLEMCFLPV